MSQAGLPGPPQPVGGPFPQSAPDATRSACESQLLISTAYFPAEKLLNTLELQFRHLKDAVRTPYLILSANLTR